jgi:hypothetical protein
MGQFVVADEWRNLFDKPGKRREQEDQPGIDYDRESV